jgi:hypothetical protein
MLYLLFDSGCTACSSTAQRVTGLGRGRIAARSLQDPAIRARLDELRPGWTAEPLLLEETSDNARVLSGMTMRRRVVQELGMRRGLEVWRLYREAGAARAPSAGMTRQRFLHRAAAAAGGAALAGSATASAASGQGSRINRSAMELLGSDAAAVQRLRSSRAVAEAARAFDGADLSGAVRVAATAELPETLVVSLGHDAMLVVADHATASETGLVIQTAQADAGLELVWKQPDGSPIGTTRIERGGRVQSVPAQRAAVPVPFVACFLGCLGVHGVASCTEKCFVCVVEKINIIACTECVACAGPRAIKCARECLK